MQIELGTLIAGAIPVIGAIVWLVRLEGRINVSDSRHEDIIGRLKRIEYKLDNGQKE